jgi:hypothetical protein
MSAFIVEHLFNQMILQVIYFEYLNLARICGTC